MVYSLLSKCRHTVPRKTCVLCALFVASAIFLRRRAVSPCTMFRYPLNNVLQAHIRPFYLYAVVPSSVNLHRLIAVGAYFYVNVPHGKCCRHLTYPLPVAGTRHHHWPCRITMGCTHCIFGFCSPFCTCDVYRRKKLYRQFFQIEVIIVHRNQNIVRRY